MTDGTKDQLAPVNRLLNRGHTRFWCYDLSAATDRLPVSLQARILGYLFGGTFGEDWKSVLVDREYHLPRPPSGVVVPDDLPETVKYAVGQPMGALSS